VNKQDFDNGERPELCSYLVAVLSVVLCLVSNYLYVKSITVNKFFMKHHVVPGSIHLIKKDDPQFFFYLALHTGSFMPFDILHFAHTQVIDQNKTR
jgi:hypothetical protein